MWFIGVKEEQETSAPPPKKNPGSALAYSSKSVILIQFLIQTEVRCMWTKSKEFKRSLWWFILFYLVCWLSTFLVVLEIYSIVTVLQLVCGYTLYARRRISSLSGYSRYPGVPLSKTQDIDLQPLIGIVYSSCPGSWQLPNNFSKI